MEPQALEDMIRVTIADAIIEITDLTGTQDHYSVIVVSKTFEGLLPLKQHRMVNKALEKPLLSGALHALQLKTYTPTEWEQIAS